MRLFHGNTRVNRVNRQRAGLKGGQTETASVREKCFHAGKPAPASPMVRGSSSEEHPPPHLSLASNPPHLLKTCHLFLSSFPTMPSLSLSLPPSVISPAWLQGRIKAERRRREMGGEEERGGGGIRKSGTRGGVGEVEALFSRGEREDRAALTHLQTPH